MRKITISLLIGIIILFNTISYSYGFEYTFTPPYYKSDDERLMVYNTINAARIKLSNGQVAATVNVTGESEIEVETVYENTEVLLIIDTSGSMGGKGIESAKKASKDLINNLINIPNMKIGLIEFNTTAKVLSGFTNNKEILENKINALITGGGTDLNGALKKIGTAISFDDSVKLGNRVIVTLTDGATSDSNGAASNYNNYESLGYKLYHVLLGHSQEAAFTYDGKIIGQIFENVSTEDLSNIFNEIYESIYSELITVQPPNLGVETKNGQLLGDQLILFLDNELIQGATLEVEYLINVKTAFDCTSLVIENILGNGYIFDENANLITNSSQTNQTFSWQIEQDTTRSEEGERMKLKYVAPTVDGYVLRSGGELSVKLIVSRLLSTTGGEIGGLTSSGEDLFNTEIKMAATGQNSRGETLDYSSDTIDLDGSNVVVTPPWGINESDKIIIKILILLLTLIISIVVIKKIKIRYH